jgi:chromate transport protein ChrA
VSETEVPGVLAVVMGALIGYDVAVTLLGVLALLLTIALFKKPKTA